MQRKLMNGELLLNNQTESFNRMNNINRINQKEMMKKYGEELSKESRNRTENERRVILF